MNRASRDIALGALDRSVRGLYPITRPVLGWLRAVRDACGISRASVARLLNVTPGAVRDYERAEAADSISMGTLRRVAESLQCDVVVALLPKGAVSFRELANRLDVSRQHGLATEHSMALEGQASGRFFSEDPLALAPGIAAVAASLQSRPEHYDKERIRLLFGFTKDEFNKVLCVEVAMMGSLSRESAMQTRLRSFAAVARLLVLNDDPQNFSSWLRTPNHELDGMTPLSLIREGRIGVVETLVHDLVTNRGR